MKTLISLYNGATSRHTKLTLLSIFVKHYTKTQLKAMVPGLTTWRIDEVRKYAVAGNLCEGKNPVIRYRLGEKKVDHFIDFISSPYYLQDVAYGTRKLKLLNGEVIEIPNMVRTVINSRMIRLYESYCQETGFTPLGRSTLFSILKVCASFQKKSLAGLDNTATEGASAFNTMEMIIHTMASLGLSVDHANNFIQRIQTAKRYLKADYKLHVIEENPCADHCIRFALSSNENQWKSDCKHDHDMLCDRCQDCRGVCEDIFSELDSKAISYSYPEQQEELKHDAEKAAEKILDWKSHIVRAINQERAKREVLDNLAYEQTLIIMDWAMKWLPQKYRETQNEWFGKKGISWHVSACITKATSNRENDVEVRTFVHILEKCNQDWFSVLSVLENLFLELPKTLPNIKEVFLRSDNAGCYHNAALITSIHTNAKKQGLILKNYSFSEANSGKDVCDRNIASLKAHINRYLNEGHDITTAEHLKEAIDSYGGLKGCQAAIIELDTKIQSATKPFKLKGISKPKQFEYNIDGEMTVWQAWNIGKGMKISKTGSPQGETGVIATRPFLKPKVTSGILKKTIVEPSSCPAAKNEPNVPDVKDKEPVKFYCPEEGCIKAYSCSRYLKQHLDIGKHEFKLHEESQYDQIRRKWAQKCTSLKPPNPSCPPMVSSASNSEEVHVPDLVTGWELKKSK